MRTLPLLAAVLVASGTARGQLIEFDLKISDFGPLAGGQVHEMQVALPSGPERMIGFSFAGTVDGITDTDSWASDLRLVLIGPDGETYEAGGSDNLVNPWSFQGSQSTNDGLYSDTHLAVFNYSQRGGTWTLRFSNDFLQSPPTMSWSGVTVTLLAVEPFCTSDLNGDNSVNIFDLLQLLGAWGSCRSCAQDLNGDDTVNVFDLLILLADWGVCSAPPPSTGACCFPDGTCDVLLESSCDSAGGAYHGAFTTCQDVDCSPKKPGLCDGLCGQFHPSGCSCENDCFAFGDCCPGVCDDCPELPECEAQMSCAGKCGGAAPSGCFCDDACVFNGDCCPDVCDQCPKLTHCQVDGSCVGACGGLSPDGCWCDNACSAFGDCCPDRCDVCPELAGCANCGTVDCTSNENEPCGADTNGGCNSSPPAFRSIGCGAGNSRCGTLWAVGGERDIDWYLFNNNTFREVTLNVVSEEPVEVFITNGLCGKTQQVIDQGSGCDVSLATCLPPGSYHIVVQNAAFSGQPCPGFKYSAAINCQTVEACPGGPDADYFYDSGSSNATMPNFFNGGVLVWMSRFEAIGGADTIGAIHAMFGTPSNPGFSGVTGGQPLGAAIYADSGNGPGALLWSTTSLTVSASAIDTDDPQVITTPNMAVSGGFFVAVWVQTAGNTFPVPRDSTIPPSISDGNAWFAGIPGGQFSDFNPANINAIAVPPTELNDAGLSGVYLLRANSAN